MFSQNRRFWKTDAKSEQKGSKNDIQIELWALWGSIFVMLDVFLKRQFFHEFSSGEKAAEKQTFGARGAEKGILRARVDGRGGVGGA